MKGILHGLFGKENWRLSVVIHGVFPLSRKVKESNKMRALCIEGGWVDLLDG